MIQLLHPSFLYYIILSSYSRLLNTREFEKVEHSLSWGLDKEIIEGMYM